MLPYYCIFLYNKIIYGEDPKIQKNKKGKEGGYDIRADSFNIRPEMIIILIQNSFIDVENK